MLEFLNFGLRIGQQKSPTEDQVKAEDAVSEAPPESRDG